MAESEKKKITPANWVFLGFMAVSLIMIIVALFTDWLLMTNGSQNESASWSDIDKMVEMGMPVKGWGATKTFAIFTLILSIVSLGMYIPGMFVKAKVFKVIGLIASILLIISGVVTFICAFVFVMATYGDIMAAYPSVVYVPHIAAYLMFIFGIIGGIFGIIGSRKI